MMKDFGRRFTVIISLIAVVVMSVTACASNKNTVVATLDGENITLGAVEFYAKYSQAMDESNYMSYFGKDMWNQEYSAGITMEDYAKDNIMDNVKEMYILKNHAKDYNISLSEEDKKAIDATVEEFLKNNSGKAKRAMGADKDSLKAFLELNTVKARVAKAMVANVDTNVSDEEAAQRTISYALLPTTSTDASGNSKPLSDVEKAAKKQQAQTIIDAANASGDFEQAVKDASLTASSASYGKGNTDSIPKEIVTEADQLTDGQIGNIVETGDGYYVVKLVSSDDKAAAAKRKIEILSERKKQAYDTLYEQWSTAAKFTVKEKVWDKVKFDTHFALVSGSDSSGE